MLRPPRQLEQCEPGKALVVLGGQVFSPEPEGVRNLLAIDGRVQAAPGDLDPRPDLDRLGIPYETIDARGCVVLPGLIDPHEHLIGGSGECGYASQTPEITLPELLAGGITTVVGCLGVDTFSRTMTALLARAKAFKEEGITALVWSGGYDVPPRTLTGSVQSDLMMVDEVVGAGEIAISDHRSSQPTVVELAKIVNMTWNGGLMSGKAGVTHFHVGDGVAKLSPLRELLRSFDIRPEALYPTHLERNEKLMEEGVELAKLGVAIDVDVEDRDLARWLKFYLERGGPRDRFTASSDAAIMAPSTLFEQLRSCVIEHDLPLEAVLPIVTLNTSNVLRLWRKGRIRAGADADWVIVDRNDFQIRDVAAQGRLMVRDRKLLKPPVAVAKGNRRQALYG